MTGKLEIQWTPISNKFITWGSDISLYEVYEFKDNYSPSLKLSHDTGAQLLATNSNHHYIKCIDIYPKSEDDLLLAIGQLSGKVTLSTFGTSKYDAQGLTGKDLVPRHTRQCNVVAWNPIETNKIIVGLDKSRSDNSILLWDIMKCPIIENNTSRLAVNTMAPAVELAKPVAEYGLSEVTNSLAWFNTNSKLVAAGMSSKAIKIIDFRETAKSVKSTMTKAVHGVCVNPYNEKYLASFIEHQIYIWDLRNFEKSILTLVANKPILKLDWCPTRQNLLSALQRDSSIINLYDIQHVMVGNEEVEPIVLERVIVPGSPHNITSFSWHKTDENRLLTMALSGSINDYVVSDRITLNWAPNSNIVWTCGRKTMKFVNDKNDSYSVLQDISHKIKCRARDGYGLKDEVWKNGQLVDDEMLTNVWNWLHLSGKLVEDGPLRGCNSKHPGIRSLLKFDVNTNKSEVVSASWSESNSNNTYGTARIYKHEDRDKALHLCGWNFDSNTLMKFLDQLEKENAFTRAAAIAVFNLKLKQAIDILNRGSEVMVGANLNVVAMALAGFSDDANSMWRQFCAQPKAKLEDPYLRAMFAFLTADNYNYDHVLNEDGMSVDDRVAFACIFLPDNKLHEYLKSLYFKLMEEGNLDGILLTGNSVDGIKLLQKYLDITGDIQSTTLIAVTAFPADLYTVKDWISCYRRLLDSWQLWNERAMFDIMLSSFQACEKPAAQVYVSCNFCGKSISAYMQGLNRGRAPFPRMGGTANKLKMSSCPNCRKPLPRCAICLMHMGTTVGEHHEESNKVIEFSHWFTWCQSCRHGGHAAHITHWFKEHTECPVTACKCKCYHVDALNNSITD